MDRYEQLLADGTLTPETDFNAKPGTGYVTDAKTGRMILAHLPPAPDPEIRYVHVPAPAPPAPVRPRDPWAGRILASGLSTAAVLVAAGQYAPQLAQVGHAVEAVGVGAGILAGGVALWKGSSPKINVTINNSNTGASSSSAAGWKPTSSS